MTENIFMHGVKGSFQNSVEFLTHWGLRVGNISTKKCFKNNKRTEIFISR